MKKVWAFIKAKKVFKWLALLLVILGVYSFAKRDSSKTIAVKNAVIEQKVVEKTVSATGEVSSENNSSLSFNSVGKLLKIYVKEGDTVKKGDLLAVLDTSALYDSIQAARDSRDIALRDKEYFIAKYLYNKSGAGGKEEYNISIRKYDELISQAEATLSLKQSQLRDASIYSPLDGIVYDITKKEGETVTISDPVVKVADLGKLVFEVELDQEDYGLVKLNQPVKIELDAYKNQKLAGKVYELPLYADGSSSPKFKVKMSFDAENTLKPLLGMTGDVHIVVAQTDKPVDALFYDEIFTDENDNYYVWVNDNGFIKKFPVEIGLEGDVYYELKTKIDKPIVIGQNSDVTVKDGYKAKLSK